MSAPDLAAAEHRGISAAATRLADLSDEQRTYLVKLLADERAAVEQSNALAERLARRSVRSTVAVRLADALLLGDARAIDTFLPVYAVAVEAEDSSRPGISAPRLRVV